jgi:hypothetical protein
MITMHMVEHGVAPALWHSHNGHDRRVTPTVESLFRGPTMTRYDGCRESVHCTLQEDPDQRNVQGKARLQSSAQCYSTVTHYS